MTENPYAAPASDPRASSDLTELMPILQGVQWPLRMSFKIITFAPTVRIYDATGRMVVIVRQKFFKLKEHVEIFADEQRTQKVAEIRANKIIDWHTVEHLKVIEELLERRVRFGMGNNILFGATVQCSGGFR